jgi:hypothetical protein
MAHSTFQPQSLQEKPMLRIRISNPIDKAPLSLVHRSVPSYSELDAALSSGPCFLIPFSDEAYFTQGWLQWAQSNLTYLWPDIFSFKKYPLDR